MNGNYRRNDSGKGRRPRQDKGKHFYKPFKKKHCRFCVENAPGIDYKNVSMLRGFLTERAKIVPRRMSGNCAKHQRLITVALKRARVLALVPFTGD